MEFYQRLKDLRTDKDLNQTELGKKIEMKQKKISRLETGKTEPTTQEIKQICKYFNISADYILGLTDIPYKLNERKK